MQICVRFVSLKFVFYSRFHNCCRLNNFFKPLHISLTKNHLINYVTFYKSGSHIHVHYSKRNSLYLVFIFFRLVFLSSSTHVGGRRVIRGGGGGYGIMNVQFPNTNLRTMMRVHRLAYILHTRRLIPQQYDATIHCV